MRYDKTKYVQLSKLGSKLNMSFSSHEVLGEKIIGLDGIKRKLIVLQTDQVNIIRLDEVNSISVKKIYSSIKAEELKKREMHEFLNAIFLQFAFKDARETFVLPFYEHDINRSCDLPGLERKVKNWQAILSKMIARQNNKLVLEN
ncbi:MAG: hypothetical protein ABI687_01960 [Flavitalea sp.]